MNKLHNSYEKVKNWLISSDLFVSNTSSNDCGGVHSFYDEKTTDNDDISTYENGGGRRNSRRRKKILTAEEEAEFNASNESAIANKAAEEAEETQDKSHLKCCKICLEED